MFTYDKSEYKAVGWSGKAKLVNLRACTMNPENPTTPGEKETFIYLEQIAGSGTEKCGELERLVQGGMLPTVDGQINLLELGTGGGDSFKTLHDRLASVPNVNYFGADNIALFATEYVKRVKGPSVVADAGALPFASESMSAVNASSIFHEVSSYGVNNESGTHLQGLAAIRQVLKEIGSILSPMGKLTYRDVSCPENILEKKEVIYQRASWRHFIEQFVPQLKYALGDAFPATFEDCKIEYDNSSTSVEATVQLQREIQRHYLTMRAYFRKAAAKESGIETLYEEWVDQQKGEKAHLIKFTDQGLEWYLERMGSQLQNVVGRSFEARLTSDEYDDFTDEVLAHLLSNQSPTFFQEWLRREGAEMYTYAGPVALREMAVNIDLRTGVGKQYELCAEDSDVHLIPRNYYSRYLEQAVNHPEYEGKQLITFTKRPKD